MCSNAKIQKTIFFLTFCWRIKAKDRGGQWSFPTSPKRAYPWSSLTERWMFCRYWGLWFPLWKCQWTMCAPQVAGWWSLHWLWLKALARGLAAFGTPWLAQASWDLENLELMQRWINTLKTEVADSYFHRGQIGLVPEWSQPGDKLESIGPDERGQWPLSSLLLWSFRDVGLELSPFQEKPSVWCIC